jgi:DNA-binding CsgD family transcriptional regulator
MVLRYASRGLNTYETAEAIQRSFWTVRSQLARARLKLGARSTTQAVAMAKDRGLIP